MVQVLAPGVQHGDEADLGAEMLGIGGDGAQRLGRGPRTGWRRPTALFWKAISATGAGSGEDDMEVRHRQQLGLPRRRASRRAPGPGTSGSAGCGRSCRRCGSRPQSAQRLDVAAERRRPAQLDGAHDPPFDAAEMAGVCLAIGVAVAAEDIRHLQIGCHGRAAQAGGTTSSVSRSSGLSVRRIEVVRDLRIARRGRQVVVAEQHLDDADIGAALQQMGGEAVPQRMHRHALGQAGRGAGRAAGGMQHLDVDRLALVAAGEQPMPAAGPAASRSRRMASSCADSMT